LSGKVRKYLIDNIDANGNFGATSKTTSLEVHDTLGSESESEEDEEGNRKMRLRRRDHVDYGLVDHDDEYFRQVEGGKYVSSSPAGHNVAARGRMKKVKSEAQLGREFAVKEASR
jgi:hypothetical protein